MRNAAGVPQTQNGTVAYGASFFGNCCRREYDLRYTTTAPFASLGFETGALNFDASVRFDSGDVSGSVTADGPVQSIDVNGDGVIQIPETKTTVLNSAGRQRIDYDYNYVSYSVGANLRRISLARRSSFTSRSSSLSRSRS